MDKILYRVEDKNVSALVIYGKSGESSPVAYADEACTVKMKTSELKNAFEKRAIINIGGALYAPISLAIASDVATVKYIVANSSTATSADLASLASVKD